MQSAPRIVRTTLLRQAPRAQTQQSSPFAASPAPSSYYSLPSSAGFSTFASPSPSTSYVPHLRFPTSNLRGGEPDARGFASSARQLASEAPQDPFSDSKFAQHAPLFERIAQSPEVISAIEHMAKITQEKTGVDLQGGDKPSMMMMMKLARDPDLRAAAERLMNALRSSGIEVDPRQAFQALQMMGGKGFEDVKGGLEEWHEKVRKGDGEGEGEGKK
ncbi:hypothetical protein JCM10213_009175 [Rhodosporidiobolus nylandii]